MKKEDKAKIISNIKETIAAYNGFYLVETAGLNRLRNSVAPASTQTSSWL